MNKPSRNEIEQSLQSSTLKASQRKSHSLDLPTKNESSRRQSRVIGGNLGGVSRKIPKKNYGWWIAAVSLILFSGLAFIIPEFINDAPKISQEQDDPANRIYTESKIPEVVSEKNNQTSDDDFTVADDRDRAAEYRKAELKLKQLNDLKAKAEAAIAEGNYTRPLNNNAIAYYQEMLSIDGNNVAATDGVNALLKRLFTAGMGNLKAGNVKAAKKSLQSLTNIDNESEEFFDLSEAINNLEAAEAKKQRDIKIDSLYAKAEKALDRERLTTPKNDNASLYFQQILELDPSNTKAREGIDKISQKYADITEEHILNREWTKAENNIKNLRLANKDSALASFLDKRLAEAKKQPAKPELEQAIASGNVTGDENNAPINNNSDKETSQQTAPTENIQTLEPVQKELRDTSIPFADNQSPPAPTQDLSVISSNVPERENFNSSAPVSDSLNTRNVQTNRTTSNTPNNQRNNQQLSSGLQAYYNGEYVTAFSSLAPLADRNVTRAQIRVGYMYQFGRGVAQNTAVGTDYLRKALPDLMNRARSNQSWAQSDLGSLYEDGIVVTQSYTEALNWYRKAAAQNYSGAQTNLGNMYFFGKGVEQSQQEAIKWYRLAALGGDAIAKQNLIQLGAVNF